MAGLGRDQGVNVYDKWRGAHWRLLSLVELGADRETPGVLGAADRTLDRSVGLAGDRATDALDLLEEKRRPDGTWRPERRWWKRPGSKGGNVDVVDWGDTANALLTELALATLQAAGR